VNIFASDLDAEALNIARKNLHFHDIRIHLVRSDLFSGFRQKMFGLIVSNPPYVETKYIKGSLCYEPRVALDGGRCGLDFIRRILRLAHHYLREGGYLVMEMGYNHKALVECIVAGSAKYELIKWIQDYAGFTRGVVLKTVFKKPPIPNPHWN